MPLETLDPTAALVVIDLQTGIVAMPVAGIPDVVRRSADLAAAFRARGRLVVLVNVDARAPGRTDTGKGSAPRSHPDGWTELVAELDTQPDDLLVTKQTWGAFASTDLDALLRERGVTQVVLTGVSTSAGVESSARQAYEAGYHVALVADAMTDGDPTMHGHSVTRVFPRLGEVTSTDEVLALLG